uniref:ABC-type branched-chain amino acid transport system, substrate-binding protein n=1 Tax=Candidatus Kentrum sp. SD TaxID=2126332 RepID=A0A450YP99_9GAMM|nr:MAG: ABC-type branched-chain amino acid transport system, substrate-binding protein [Candidatus Kentron sp. SD]VFK43332.1 MAG: ABC-type branched-chain amino acid transport system, substrate-binding protein [Candidatus Kentron sp. SD]
MLSFVPRKFTRRTYVFVFFIVTVLFSTLFLSFYPEKEYKIGIIVSSTKNNHATIELIKFFVKKRIDEFNKKGGINGRPVKEVYMDDFEDSSLTIRHVEKILRDEYLVGILGCWNSTRAKEIVDLIGTSGVPFIGDFSINTFFSNYGNIYSMDKGVSDELAIFDKFLNDRAIRNVAFIGRLGDLYTIKYYNYIKDSLASDRGIAYEKWLLKSEEIDESALENIISDVEKSRTDIIFLSLGARNGILIESLHKNNIRIPVYSILGTIGKLLSSVGYEFDFDWYDTAVEGIPNVESQRLEELIARYRSDISSIDSSRYLAGYGGRYADGVGMILDAAKSAASQEIRGIREHVIESLRSYISSRRFYKGWSRYWAFTENRTSSEDILLVWKPANYDGFILYPEQYARKAGGYVRKPVIYLNVDMIRITGVNNSEKSFSAEFYLNIKSEDPGIDKSYIEFTNAYRGKDSNEPLINIRAIDEDTGINDNSKGKLQSNYLYKVSGKFDFYPDLRLYPFDEQKFSISFQPRNAAHDFLIQPPKEELRDTDFSTDEWVVNTHYVGMDQDIIRSTKGYVSEEMITPFYKFNYTWVMERSKVDYFIKTVIPLLTILTITYLSVYIRKKNFEATVTIQVTALLASIALYFSVYKPTTDYATLSDEIFLFTYFSITLMMAMSIFKSIRYVEDFSRLMFVANLLQRYAFPAFVLSMVAYVFSVKYFSV